MNEQSLLFAAEDEQLGDIERWCRREGVFPVIGVDEAGRGPLAGPVYAAAVSLDLRDADDAWFELLDDSKKLSEAAREDAAVEIKRRAIAWAVCFRDAVTIDEINILQATLRAMEEAIARVATALEPPPMRVFIDGNQRVATPFAQQTLVKGDGRSYHVAAASILAKTERDRLMKEHHERWPEYGFDQHKGYGTRAHRDAIARFGPCPIHRLTFGGVREHADRVRR